MLLRLKLFELLIDVLQLFLNLIHGKLVAF